MPEVKKIEKSEEEKRIAEKMRLRLHQSYNIECPKCTFKDKK